MISPSPARARTMSPGKAGGHLWHKFRVTLGINQMGMACQGPEVTNQEGLTLSLLGDKKLSYAPIYLQNLQCHHVTLANLCAVFFLVDSYRTGNWHCTFTSFGRSSRWRNYQRLSDLYEPIPKPSFGCCAFFGFSNSQPSHQPDDKSPNRLIPFAHFPLQ